MWTPATRAELAREDLPDAPVLSDAEGAVVAPLMPTPASTGRPWRWPLRAAFDGILHACPRGVACAEGLACDDLGD